MQSKNGRAVQDRRSHPQTDGEIIYWHDEQL
jgi:hypothetical protein